MEDDGRRLTELVQDFEKIRMRRIALENLKFIHLISWCVLGAATFILVFLVV